MPRTPPPAVKNSNQDEHRRATPASEHSQRSLNAIMRSLPGDASECMKLKAVQTPTRPPFSKTSAESPPVASGDGLPRVPRLFGGISWTTENRPTGETRRCRCGSRTHRKTASLLPPPAPPPWAIHPKQWQTAGDPTPRPPAEQSPQSCRISSAMPP